MKEIKVPKKLIEVSLPLDEINAASGREKSIRFGHPSTMHLWWARRPLAAARAIIFAQMVNDPGYESGKGFKRGVNKKEAEKKRKHLFEIIRDLVKWENTTNQSVLKRAQEAIAESWKETCELNKDHPNSKDLFNPSILPEFHDPFAGGGAIPLEAQRLGLKSYASDLNPIPVLLNKSMIELPKKYVNARPIGPISEGNQAPLDDQWGGLTGLVEDVFRFGSVVLEKAKERIGNLYPAIKVSEEIASGRPSLKPYVGQDLTVIAYLWARTVSSPSPAFNNSMVPLTSTFALSTKKGKEAWVKPLVNGDKYEFKVIDGPFPKETKSGTKSNRANFVCLLSGEPISSTYIKEEASAGRMGQELLAIVAEGKTGRVYLPPNEEIGSLVNELAPAWVPDYDISGYSQYMGTLGYGMTKFSDLFNNRQLVAINTFTEEISVDI